MAMRYQSKQTFKDVGKRIRFIRGHEYRAFRAYLREPLFKDNSDLSPQRMQIKTKKGCFTMTLHADHPHDIKPEPNTSRHRCLCNDHR